MSKFIMALLVLAFSAMCFISSAQTGNSLKAKVVTSAGQLNFVAQQVVVKKSAVANKNYFVLIAISTQGRIEMKINKDLTTGTYTIDNKDRKTVMFFTETKSPKPYMTGKCSDATGTLTITQMTSTEVKGKFSFVGKTMFANCEAAEKATITNGEFSASF